EPRGAAARARRRPQPLVHSLQADARVAEVVLAGEDERDVAGRAAQPERGARGGLGEGVDAAVAVDEAGGAAHDAHASSICWPAAEPAGGGPGSRPLKSRTRRDEPGGSRSRLMSSATVTSTAAKASAFAR